MIALFHHQPAHGRHSFTAYEQAIQASECARPDLAPPGSPRRQMPLWQRPGLIVTATVCAALLSSLALML